MTEDTKVLTSCIESLLELIGLEKTIPMLFWSQENDFRNAWDEKFVKSNATGTCIVIWDGMPTPKVNLQGLLLDEHLSPVDWAVAASALLGEKAHFRVIVLDIRVIGNDNRGVRLCRRASGFAPWITICQGNDNLTKALLETPYLDGSPGHLEDLEQYWQGLLLKPSGDGAQSANHHAISNILGPVLLLEHNPDPQSAFLTALSSMTKWLKLMRGYIGACKESWVTFDNVPEDLNLLLLDDCAYSYHWANVLYQAVGGEQAENDNLRPLVGTMPSGKLFAMDNPSNFLDALSTIEGTQWKDISGKDNPPDWRFSLGFEGNPVDILFLDMYLFQGEMRREEDLFLLKLIFVAEKFPELKAAVTAVRQWLEIKLEERSPNSEVLTLLARVIALIDPSLPIVLFSSTGRRENVQKLHDYPSIITDFEKPRLETAQGSNIYEETKFKFATAFNKAMTMVRARRFCQQLRNKQDQSPSTIAGQQTPAPKHFEIYIDESSVVEKTFFHVAGLLVGYKDEQTATDIHTTMETLGIVGYGLAPKIIHGITFKTTAEITEAEINVIQPVGELFKNANCLVVPFAFFRHPDPVFPPQQKIFDVANLNSTYTGLIAPDSLDTMYVELARIALDACINELIPFFRNQSETPSIQIYLATRQRVFQRLSEKEWTKSLQRALNSQEKTDLQSQKSQTWCSLYERWGIEGKVSDKNNRMRSVIEGDTVNASVRYLVGSTISTMKEYVKVGEKYQSVDCDERYVSLQQDSVYPLVAEVFRSRANTSVNVEWITRAVGVQLTYGKNPPKYAFFRNQHYLADLVARFSNKQSNAINYDYFGSVWEPVSASGAEAIGEICNDDYRMLMLASQLVESGTDEDFVVALLALWSIRDNRAGNGLLDKVIISKIAQRMMMAKVGWFHQFAALIEVTEGPASYTVLAATRQKAHKTTSTYYGKVVEVEPDGSGKVILGTGEEIRIDAKDLSWGRNAQAILEKDQIIRILCSEHDGNLNWSFKDSYENPFISASVIVGQQFDAEVKKSDYGPGGIVKGCFCSIETIMSGLKFRMTGLLSSKDYLSGIKYYKGQKVTVVVKRVHVMTNELSFTSV